MPVFNKDVCVSSKCTLFWLYEKSSSEKGYVVSLKIALVFKIFSLGLKDQKNDVICKGI